MPLDPILVSTHEELVDAYTTLSNTPGGGEIHLSAEAEGMDLRLGGGGDEPVTISSADPDDPVTISRISFNNLENVHLKDVNVDSSDTDRPDWQTDLHVGDSSDITISNVTFTSDGSGFYDPSDADAVLGEDLGRIMDSDGVTFSGNHVSGYYQGLAVFESTGTTVEGNTFTELQGDGIRLAGVQDTVIADNHLHNFYGTLHSFNHNDMIQVWSTNADLVTTNLTISGNFLDSGDGAASQSIFIRNETFDTGLDTTHIYEDITITNNLIYNGHSHGISVGGADGVVVTDNTLIWNTDSVMIGNTGDEGYNSAPRINLSNNENVTAENNVAEAVNVPDDAVLLNNLELDYTSLQSPDYVTNHIVNPNAGGDATLDDLRLRPDSEYVGTGSDQSDPLLTSAEGVTPVIVTSVDVEDPQTVTFDAGFSVDEAGFVDLGNHTFEWTFADGTVLQGPTVTHSFTDSGDQSVTLAIHDGTGVVAESDHAIAVESHDFLMMDFSQGLADQSDYSSQMEFEGASLNAEGDAMRIGGDDWFGTTRNNDHYHDLDSFGFEINLEVLGNSAGNFMRFGQEMDGRITSEGEVTFRMITDEGTFTVASGDVHVGDGAAHDIGLAYSNEGGMLVLTINGEIVDQTEASGSTPSGSSHGLIIGTPWHTTVDALVNTVYFGADPAEIGVIIEPDIDPSASIEDPVGKESPTLEPQVLPDEIYEVDAVAEEPDVAAEDPPEVPTDPKPSAGEDDTFDEFIFNIDFDAPLSEQGLRVNSDAGQIGDGADGAGYSIGGDQNFEIDRTNEEIHSLDSFELSFDIRFEDEDPQGTFVYFHDVFRAKLQDDGQVTFELQTDEGDFSLSADGDLLTDGEMHNFSIWYSDEAGKLEMRIDDVAVDQIDASGTTADAKWWGMIFGSNWHTTQDATIDNLELTTNGEDVLSSEGAKDTEEAGAGDLIVPDADADTDAGEWDMMEAVSALPFTAIFEDSPEMMGVETQSEALEESFWAI